MRDLSYIKHILGIGCSYTRNSSEESAYREKSKKKASYIKQLSSKLDISYTNLAVGGHSFHSLFFTFFEWIENNKELAKDTLVIIGLTHFNRLNFWTPDGIIHNMSYHTPNNGSYEYLRDHLYPLTVDLDDYVIFQNTLFKYFTHTTQQQKAEIIYMKQVERYCIDNNIAYIFIDIPGEGHRFSNLPKWHDILDKVYTFPDGSKYWKEYISNYDKNYAAEHPNYEDHAKLADLLYQYINI